MAVSKVDEKLFTSAEFVESAGVILFHVSTRRICLVRWRDQEWLLAKGRRNVGESRAATALREAREETGFSCHLLPVKMQSRCCPQVETGPVPDEPRGFEDVCEPFMLAHRTLPHDSGIKLIWWYIGAIDENSPIGNGESQFSARLFDFPEALRTLTFANDRETVARAIEIFEATQGGRSMS